MKSRTCLDNVLTWFMDSVPSIVCTLRQHHSKITSFSWFGEAILRLRRDSVSLANFSVSFYIRIMSVLFSSCFPPLLPPELPSPNLPPANLILLLAIKSNFGEEKCFSFGFLCDNLFCLAEISELMLWFSCRYSKHCLSLLSCKMRR